MFDSNWILPRTYDGLNDQFVRLVGTEGTAYINITYQGLRVFKPEFQGDFEHSNRATVYVNPMFNGRTTGCVERSVATLWTASSTTPIPVLRLRMPSSPPGLPAPSNSPWIPAPPVKL